MPVFNPLTHSSAHTALISSPISSTDTAQAKLPSDLWLLKLIYLFFFLSFHLTVPAFDKADHSFLEMYLIFPSLEPWKKPQLYCDIIHIP